VLEFQGLQQVGKEVEMPISRAQFEKGMEDLNYKIIAFLKAHSNEAFELSELTEAVFGVSASAKTTAEVAARNKKAEFPLADFVKQGLVEKKTIGGRDYYAIRLE
jgi:PBP1b-binding outer membrane lipoprotein LpoB